jgi:dihydroxyacetone kinase-like protein
MRGSRVRNGGLRKDAVDFITLQEQSQRQYRRYIGEFATSLEMAGCSITLLKLDGELKPLLDAPASSPFFLQV